MPPPEFRDALKNGDPEARLVLTGYDGCLVGFPTAEWEAFEERLAAIQNPSRLLRDFRRLVIGGAEDIVLDRQGRAALSPELRAYAGIEREAVLLGQLTKFEIWSPERLSVVEATDFSTVHEELAACGVEAPL